MPPNRPYAMRNQPVRRLITLLLLTLTAPLVTAEIPVTEFSFLQVTDMHLSPNLARLDAAPALRGADSIAWICAETPQAQQIDPLNLQVPRPAFTIATGDLTEFGVVDRTWEQVQQAFASLPGTFYAVPGNHDNTWVAMYHIMRQRHGGANYSFDYGGCHFICLCSASPQEPVPSLDGQTRAWLKRDLAKTGRNTPIVVAMHHPPDSGEMAQPAEFATLIDTLRDYNVVLILYGHGHSIRHTRLCGFDGVMGGSTYGPRAGYGVCAVQDGKLRYAYRYYRKPSPEDAEDVKRKPGWRVVLEKSLPTAPAPRLFDMSVVHGDAGTPRLRLQRQAELQEVRVQVDGRDLEQDEAGLFAVPADELTPGWHMLTASAGDTAGGADLRAVAVRTADPRRWRTARLELGSAVKAAPVIVDDKIVIAQTDGTLAAYERAAMTTAADTNRDGAPPEPAWTFTTGGEILGTPTWTGERLIFGAGDGLTRALDGDGKCVWTHASDVPVYGWPATADNTVYIGDNHGRLYALDIATGEARWTYSRADYAIESWPQVWGDVVVFGAWDGYLYALDRATGKVAWKTWGPKSSEGRAARYYAPADCGPIAIDDTLFVCDRGYVLGRYDRTGTQGPRVAEKVSAIVRAPSGDGLFARRLDDHVCRYDGEGKLIWETEVPAGRFPVPPTCADGRVYVCSNRGLLSVLDAADGALLWQYQATPGFYVMAPVTVDDAGTCYVVGMDGSLSVIRPPASKPKAMAASPS